MSDPQILIVGGTRPRGRPKPLEPMEQRSFYLPASYMQRIDRLALKHGISTNEAMRKVVDLALRMPSAETIVGSRKG